MQKSVLAAIVALAVFVADQAVAESVNPMRERVRQWEIRMLENAVGKERAAELLAPKPNAEIVGGNTAPAGKWPWQVALLFNRPNFSNFDNQFCGGTLVGELFVVTAAHCITENNGSVSAGTSIRVLTGTQTLSKIPGQNAGGVRREIQQIVRHPQYNDNTADYDIAVIKLKTPATGIQTARLLTVAQEPTLAATGNLSFVTGWGDTESVPTFPAQLQQVQVPIVSREACKNSYGNDIKPRMICAGLPEGGKDSCQGDSGGPLIVRDNEQGPWRVLAGVVSWGSGCADPNFFGVYSRVAVFRNWVVQTMAALTPEVAATQESTRCSDLRGSSQSACLDGLSLAPK
jgi:secreted trypsin-like serine protease